MEVSYVYTDSQCSEEDEENLESSTSKFKIFDEVRIRVIVIDCFDHSLVAFEKEDIHDINR